jgi:hypothetical protein
VEILMYSKTMGRVKLDHVYRRQEVDQA